MNQLTTLLLPDLRQLLVEGEFEELSRILAEFHPADAADFINAIESGEALKMFNLLAGRHRVSTFEHLAEDRQCDIIHALGRKTMLEIVEEMAPDERADLLKMLPPKTVDEILPLMAQAERDDIKKLLQYQEGTAGSIMTTELSRYSKSTEDC